MIETFKSNSCHSIKYIKSIQLKPIKLQHFNSAFTLFSLQKENHLVRSLGSWRFYLTIRSTRMANISFFFLFGCKICTSKSLHYTGFSETSTDTFLKQSNCTRNKDFLKYLLIFQFSGFLTFKKKKKKIWTAKSWKNNFVEKHSLRIINLKTCHHIPQPPPSFSNQFFLIDSILEERAKVIINKWTL